MKSFEDQMRNKPSFMFQSQTERKTIEVDGSLPGPSDYNAQSLHLLKRDFSRPRVQRVSPTRNTDGAFRTELNIHSNELKHKNISPGPVPSLISPGGGAKDR